MSYLIKLVLVFDRCYEDFVKLGIMVEHLRYQRKGMDEPT